MQTAKNFFTKEEQALLVEAIHAAETHTSGELRLHLENFCFGNEMKAAERVFTRLKMHETAERNGVLIYIATISRKVAIVGDKGIHEKLGNAYWQELVQKLISQFKHDHKAEGLCNCIVECGEKLAKFFPRQHDDKNELSNTISY